MKNILVAIDFSTVTDKLLAEAIRLAKAFGSALLLIHVSAPEPSFVGNDAGPQQFRDRRAKELREEHHTLERYRKEIEAQGIAVKALLVQGPTLETLLEQADSINADVIIAGSHGHGALHHLLVGSVSEGLLRKAKCPVLLVPARHV
ncbi:MAG: universal stress protein [Desulfobulbaceae bacterium]|nr:universal stress protein [Desulfobulbaceae bacterium]